VNKFNTGFPPPREWLCRRKREFFSILPKRLLGRRYGMDENEAAKV
jgi:hypothetical protein